MFDVQPISYSVERFVIAISGKRYIFSPVPLAVHRKFLTILKRNRGRAIHWLQDRVGMGQYLGTPEPFLPPAGVVAKKT